MTAHRREPGPTVSRREPIVIRLDRRGLLLLGACTVLALALTFACGWLLGQGRRVSGRSGLAGESPAVVSPGAPTAMAGRAAPPTSGVAAAAPPAPAAVAGPGAAEAAASPPGPVVSDQQAALPSVAPAETGATVAPALAAGAEGAPGPATAAGAAAAPGGAAVAESQVGPVAATPAGEARLDELGARALAALDGLRRAELQLGNEVGPGGERGLEAAGGGKGPGGQAASGERAASPLGTGLRAGPAGAGAQASTHQDGRVRSKSAGGKTAGRVRPPAGATATPPDGSRFTLQVSAFQDREEANELIRLLRSHGHNPYLMETEVPGRGRWYRVRLGKFSDRKAAEEFQARFEREEKISTYISSF